MFKRPRFKRSNVHGSKTHCSRRGWLGLTKRGCRNQGGLKTVWWSRGGVGVRDNRGTAVLQVASAIIPPGVMGTSLHWSATLPALLDFWLHSAALVSHVQRVPPRALLDASTGWRSRGGVAVRDNLGTAVLQVASAIIPPGEMGASLHWSATLHALLDFWLHSAALVSHVQRVPPRALIVASWDRCSGGGCRCSCGGSGGGSRCSGGGCRCSGGGCRCSCGGSGSGGGSRCSGGGCRCSGGGCRCSGGGCRHV